MGLARLDLVHGLVDLTSAQDRSTRHWPDSTSARAQTTRPCPELSTTSAPGLHESTTTRSNRQWPRSGQPDPDELTSASTLRIRHCFGLKWFYIGLGPDYSTSTWTTRHRHGPARLELMQGLADSTLPGPRRLNIGPGPNDSTSIWARSTRPRATPGRLKIARPTRLDLVPGSAEHCPSPLCTTTARACSIRPWIRPVQPGLDDSTSVGLLGSISAWARSTQHQPWRLDIGPGPYDSTLP